MQIFQRMFKRCNDLIKWNEFIESLKKYASAEDQFVLIDYTKFE